MFLRALALTLALTPPALAQSLDAVQSAMLRPGWQMASGSQMTALDLRLAPGWKTYWRAPGDAGIPPRFDWSGSGNLARVIVHWPTPQVFDLNGLTTVGYHDALLLPIELVPVDPGQPVTVRLTADLGVCKEVCVPAQVTASLTALGAGKADPAIRAALASGPMTPQEAGLQQIACTVAPISDGLRLTARADLPPLGPAPEMAVFETGDAGIWISQAEVAREGGTLTAAADLVGQSGAPFALERAGVTLTLISGGASVEIRGCPAP